MKQLVPQWGIHELSHTKLWAAVLGVFACIPLCCCSQTSGWPQGSHNSHPSFHQRSGKQPEEQSRHWSDGGTGKGNPLLASPDRQLPDASSRWVQRHLDLSARWEPLTAAIHGHKTCVRTKLQKNHKWEQRNVFYVRLSVTALQCCAWEEHQTRDKQTHPQIFMVTHCCAEGWGKPPPLLC